MTNFPFNTGIPAALNNPSSDQPLMLINTQSDAGIWEIDHIGFNTNNGGTHKQVTLSSKNTPGSQTDPSSVLYTASGTASTVADLRFVNQNATFPISFIRAWALCTTTGIVSLQGFNVAVVRSSAGVYVATLGVNAINSANFSVFVSVPSFGSNALISNITYAIGGSGPWTVTFNFTNSSSTPTDPATFSFFVMQV